MQTMQTTQTTQMIRQGDVLLVPVNPVALKRRPAATPEPPRNGRLVLARGESSLHEHTIPANAAEIAVQEGRRYLTVLRNTTLSVTDSRTRRPLSRHTPAQLPGGGFYEVRIQREFLPESLSPNNWSTVSD